MKPTSSLRCRTSLASLLCAVIPVLLLGALLPAHATPSVVILSPKPKAIVCGVIQIVAAPSTETSSGFSYATMFIDESGRSISNSLPLRFDLDTTKIPNGLYVIRVDTFNISGGFQGSASVPITVYNASVNELGAPVPASQPMKLKSPLSPPEKSDDSVQPQAVAPTVKQAAAPAAPTLLLDGKYVATVPPMTIEGGRAIVTLRPLVVAAGGEVSWDAAKQQVTVAMDGKTIVLTVNDAVAMVDGKPVDLGMPVRVAQGRTLIPAAAWKTAFGGGVEYNSDIRCVMLSTNTAYLASARLDR